MLTMTIDPNNYSASLFIHSAALVGTYIQDLLHRESIHAKQFKCFFSLRGYQ